MRKAFWLSSFCLWPLAALAGENTSVYSRFDLETTCRQVAPGDGMSFAGTWRCAGFRGTDITISIDDDRSHVGFGPEALDSCAYRKTFTRFNEALSPVEWRLKDGVPIATIERWRVTADEQGNSVTWLVVTALRGAEACPYRYVAGSYPKANEVARQHADSIPADFDCARDVPGVVSKVGAGGILLESCTAAAAE